MTVAPRATVTVAPRTSRRMAATAIVVALAVSGAALGAVWAWLAPPIHTLTGLARSGERLDGFVGKEADNVFVAAAMLIGLLTMLAVVSTVWVWQWRAHRGPTQVTALWVGQIVAGATAAGVGAALAHVRYGSADHAGVPLSQENRVHYFIEAPPVFLGHNPLQIAVTLFLPAAVAALAYAAMTVATLRDDLHAWPPIDHPLTVR